MKRLFIVRHGKAAAHGLTADIERPLTSRGVEDVSALGDKTTKVRTAGDPLCCSPASRTHQTAQILCNQWHEDARAITLEADAYLASDRAWLNWINAWNNDFDSGWIVGHNPGLSDLVARLCDQHIWLPTSGLAEIELLVDHWSEAFAGTGRLRGLLTPKSQLSP